MSVKLISASTLMVGLRSSSVRRLLQWLIRASRNAGTFSCESVQPAAASCPPNCARCSLQAVKAAWMLKFEMDRAEPEAEPSGWYERTTVGRW